MEQTSFDRTGRPVGPQYLAARHIVIRGRDGGVLQAGVLGVNAGFH